MSGRGTRSKISLSLNKSCRTKIGNYNFLPGSPICKVTIYLKYNKKLLRPNGTKLDILEFPYLSKSITRSYGIFLIIFAEQSIKIRFNCLIYKNIHFLDCN